MPASLRKKHVCHQRGMPRVVSVGSVADSWLDASPPRVRAERAVVAREARPAEAVACLEARLTHAMVRPHRKQDGVLVGAGRAVGDVACMRKSAMYTRACVRMKYICV